MKHKRQCSPTRPPFVLFQAFLISSFLLSGGRSGNIPTIEGEAIILSIAPVCLPSDTSLLITKRISLIKKVVNAFRSLAEGSGSGSSSLRLTLEALKGQQEIYTL